MSLCFYYTTINIFRYVGNAFLIKYRAECYENKCHAVWWFLLCSLTFKCRRYKDSYSLTFSAVTGNNKFLHIYVSIEASFKSCKNLEKKTINANNTNGSFFDRLFSCMFRRSQCSIQTVILLSYVYYIVVGAYLS